MKGIKNLVLFIIFILFSCKNSYVYKDYPLFEEDEDFEIKGNVDSISCYEVSIYRKDTSKIVLFYNEKGKLIKQKDIYKKGIVVCDYTYNDKNQLITETYRNSKTTYDYDEFGNLISYKNFEKDNLIFEKNYSYKDNLLIKCQSFKKNVLSENSIYEYNHKKKASVLKDTNNIIVISRLHDKKGNVIESASQYGIIKLKYDKYNRLIEKICLDTNGKLKYKNQFLNKYDENNNLIETIKMTDGKFSKKSYYLIAYRNK